MFGAGLLVGTALVVIIPEGIESLYSELIVHWTVVLICTAQSLFHASSSSNSTSGIVVSRVHKGGEYLTLHTA